MTEETEFGEPKRIEMEWKEYGKFKGKEQGCTVGIKYHYEVCVSAKGMTESNIELDLQ